MNRPLLAGFVVIAIGVLLVLAGSAREGVYSRGEFILTSPIPVSSGAGPTANGWRLSLSSSAS